MSLPVFIVTGVPGTGKSSVCRALMQTFAFGLHLPVDDLREFVVSGIAHPVPTFTGETRRQFRLARQGAGRVAELYGQAGFAVAIDDVLGPDDAADFGLSAAPMRVLLRAELDAVLERNRLRQNKSFDLSALDPVIRSLHAAQDVAAYRRAGWQVIQTDGLSVQQTVAEILRGQAEQG